MERNPTPGAACARELIRRGPTRKVTGGAARRRLKEAGEALDEVAARIRDMSAPDLPGSLEWLADNRHVLVRERENAARALKGLPGGGRHVPYVFVFSEALVRECFRRGEQPTHEAVLGFCREAADAVPFEEAELRALPDMLRLAVLLFLASQRDALLMAARSPEQARRGRGRTADRETARRMAYGFSMLRCLSALRLGASLEELSTVERLYRTDPAGVYADMDEETRRAYRARTEALAKRARVSEERMARRILELCAAGGTERERHVGRYLFESPPGVRPLRAARVLYALLLPLLPLSAAALIAVYRGPAAGLFSFPPLFTLFRALIERVLLRFLPRRLLPRMSDEKPPASRTLCVITALLTSPEDAEEYAKKLEEYRLAAGKIGGRMTFGLLPDLRESEREREPEDEAIHEAARRAIDALNEKWGGSFTLFWRDRSFSARDRRYMGRERKRGAIEDLVRLLRGRPTGLRAETGAPDPDIRYIITLDADTEPSVGALRRLVAAMEHPLNRPVIDPRTRTVTAGHALLHPRIGMGLETASQNTLASVYAGPGGSDPYGGVSPDLFYDLCGESGFTGKGIFDVDAYAALLDGRFPENAILSHDLLEGAYLRAGFAADVVFLDGFPGSVRTYFAREHRWIRGDWQLLPWLFPRVRTGTGRERNPLGGVVKLRIADNLRRSLVPLWLTNAILVSLWSRVGMAPAVAAAAASIAPLFYSFLVSEGTKERYRSRVLPALRAAAYRVFFDFAALPYRAWIGVSAAATAIFRTFITHRGMLDWTTAAQAEGKAESVHAYYRRMWPCALAATLALSAPYRGPGAAAFAVLAAFFWLAAPYAAHRLSAHPAPQDKTLGEEDRARFLLQAEQMFSYFRDFVNAENCWLPPDNLQLQPAVGLARRTSPTNIGLAMLSFLAAVDLGLFSAEEAIDRLERMTGTLERMEKWNGHLYNWYRTADARPMSPRRVSTVDSGNLIACLIALGEGLAEMPGDRANALARRLRRLAGEMRLSPLFDRERCLFRLGWDAEADRPAEGWYDLLASEARLTSYIAVARGEADARHWGRLGRALVGADGYRGLASWSGTMFEYLMPPLLLPTIPNSLFYESERFALHCQQRRAPAGMPYGISESGFFAFDTDMNYQYKAHGVQALGFKRGLDRETVLAPYAGYLALLVDPRDAAENLRRYDALDMAGKYGLYEALDMTRPRVPEGCPWLPVRSYMAHHLGMSLLAVTHVLADGVMQRRFMADPHMGAFRSLLCERIPVGAAADGKRETADERPARALPAGGALLYEGEGYDAWRPHCVMLSNGSYRVLCTDTGLNRTLCGMRDLTRFDGQAVGGAEGVLFFVTDGETLTSLTPAPFFDESAEYGARFETACASVTMRRGDLASRLSVMVCPDDTAGIRRIGIRNTGGAPLDVTLVCYLEPVLDTMQAYGAHPAFARLFLDASPQPDGVLVTRRAPDGEESSLYVACSERMENVCTSRERALGRFGYAGLKRTPEEGTTSAPDPCVCLRIPLRLRPQIEQAVTVSLAFGKTPEDARSAARRALGLNHTAAPQRIGELMGALSLSAKSADAAFRMYRDALFVTPDTRRLAPYRERSRMGRETLWKYGVSGDLPVIAVRAGREPGEREERILARHMLLYCCGAYADLLLFLDDGGDYERRAHAAALDLLGLWGGENLVGTRGGVHLIEEARLAEGELDALIALSGVFFDLRGTEEPQETPGPLPVVIPPDDGEARDVSAQPGTEFFQDGVRFAGLPTLAWSHPLANRVFGYLAADAGTGHLWYYNSRENKLSPWINDPLAVTGPETIEVLLDGKAYSLFARDAASRVTYEPGTAVWERELPGLSTRLTAYVHPRDNVRVMIAELEGERASSASLRWFLKLVLSDRPDGQVRTVFSPEKSVIYAENGANRLYAPYLFAFTSSPAPARFTCDEADYRSGNMRYKTGAGLLPCFAARIPLEREGDAYRAVIVCGCAPHEKELSRVRAFAEPGKAEEGLAFTRSYWADLAGGVRVKTPEPRLDSYLNVFGAYQVIAGRLFARTSMYQCSGAYGFRDQLQDARSLLSLPPSGERLRLVRAQLLRAAAHQYSDGDVQHWWHPDRVHDRGRSERGVRTRMTDDLLFLPYTALAYLHATGDRAFFEQKIPYLREPALAPGEMERFGTPERANDLRESLWRHCVRAAECFRRRGAGQRGLALIGGGDWNDAMNRVGAGGRGESVWLSWFGAMVLTDMAREARVRGDEAHAADWEAFADALKNAAYATHDGRWFLRGRFDDGTPLGAPDAAACRIDAISQAFAPLADPAPEEAERRAMQQTALRHAAALLWDRGPLVRLFTPPFTKDSFPSPGYIKAYPPGIRENGGQYTHGAVWLALGLFRAGMAQEAGEMLLSLLPAARGERYLAEPYYLAADVYSADGLCGRGGWSIYTGAAGWFLSTALTELLGLRFRRGRLTVTPHIPREWSGFEARIDCPDGTVELTVRRDGVPGLRVEGRAADYIDLPRGGACVRAELVL